MDLEYLVESPIEQRHRAFTNGTYASTTTCYVKFIHRTDMPLGGGEWADGCKPPQRNLANEPLGFHLTEGTVHLRELGSDAPPLVRIDRDAERKKPANHMHYGESYFSERSGEEAYDLFGHLLKETRRPIIAQPRPTLNTSRDDFIANLRKPFGK